MGVTLALRRLDDDTGREQTLRDRRGSRLTETDHDNAANPHAGTAGTTTSPLSEGTDPPVVVAVDLVMNFSNDGLTPVDETMRDAPATVMAKRWPRAWMRRPARHGACAWTSALPPHYAPPNHRALGERKPRSADLVELYVIGSGGNRDGTKRPVDNRSGARPGQCEPAHAGAVPPRGSGREERGRRTSRDLGPGADGEGRPDEATGCTAQRRGDGNGRGATQRLAVMSVQRGTSVRSDRTCRGASFAASSAMGAKLERCGGALRLGGPVCPCVRVSTRYAASRRCSMLARGSRGCAGRRRWRAALGATDGERRPRTRLRAGRSVRCPRSAVIEWRRVARAGQARQLALRVRRESGHGSEHR